LAGRAHRLKADMSGSTIFTIGHGNRTTEALAGILGRAGVGRLVDVRRWPTSRRNPHFNKDALESALPGYSIAYDWRGEELGGRRRPREDSRHTAWRAEPFRGYADHMDTQSFRRVLADLEEDAGREPPLAIMCAETLWWRCHRRLISDALVLRGHTVLHLIDLRSTQPHRLHDSIRAEAGNWPVYDIGPSGEVPLRSSGI
jgi:uncharacterized protein (DUF488 family)